MAELTTLLEADSVTMDEVLLDYEGPNDERTTGLIIEWLSQDGGAVPCSRYGRTSAECAPVALLTCWLLACETGEPITVHGLEGAMSWVVNDHDAPEDVVRELGPMHNIDPTDWIDG